MVRKGSTTAKLGALLRLFHRLIVRPLLRDPIRTTLTAISIALGVAVVVAIDLAGDAAAGSFKSSVETLSGTASLVITGTGGVDENLLGRLVRLPYPFRFSPRTEDFATANGTGAAIPFIGLDWIDNVGREGTNSAENFGDIRNPLLVGKSLGWHRGQKVRLLINDRTETFTVAGILPESSAGLSENRAVVSDIGLAQLATGKLGRLDSIAVTTPDYGTLEQWEQLLRKTVGPSVSVERSGARTDQNRKMLAAFRWNLQVLSYISLVVGAFLIYNTVSVSVARRRPEIGVLRALGTTRSGILAGVLIEAAAFGVTGGVAGLLLGRALALGAVQLIGNTVQMLYVSSQPGAIRFTGEAVLTGLLMGIGTSLIAALAPAVEASLVRPVEAMSRGRREYVVRLHTRRNLLCSLGLAAASVVCAMEPPLGGRPLFGYVSAICLIASAALAIPDFVSSTSNLLGSIVRRVFGVEAFLALRGLRASLNRTSVLVGALTTAIAMMASVGIMVGSFRQTVAVWMDRQLRADLYLRPAGNSAADRHPTIAPEIADAVERIPGVAAVDRFRVYPLTYQGVPASLGGGETSKAEANADTLFLPGENRTQILDQLPKGDNVVISEPFANKHHLRPGDVIRFPIGEGIHAFRVLGIYYDYSTERGFVIMDRQRLLRYLPDPAASNLAIYLKRGTNVELVRDQVSNVIGSRGIAVFTNAKLRHDALRVFDRTFQITWALEAVAIVVAVMGMAGALLALIIDRRREFALLRFLGADHTQVRKIILAEAGALGLLSNVMGLVLGTALSLVLIYVINKQSFGWTIQFHWPVALLLIASTGICISTLLAGLYPARTAVRLNPIEAVHEE